MSGSNTSRLVKDFEALTNKARGEEHVLQRISTQLQATNVMLCVLNKRLHSIEKACWATQRKVANNDRTE